ncbi:cell envelope biogenesis protein OmpA [Tamlana sedimentorum]|uniref:Cell envelope biogenesis protein OmpA n=1 Tax=Neotamlana sedimentorum TaxID=1435349 RepID=A0A0D7WGG1_9FLAO|nr:OmpA family protein [Tamlana sedimentorum]KJD36822.1 cell envelope biogenesis protein OmpA [Tamlana sedimentorum]
MKNIFCLCCSILLVAVSYGQTSYTEKADKLFDTYQYVDAIDAYLQLVEKQNADAHVYKQLADSYYNVFNINEAAKWYEMALTTSQDAETYYRYANVLKSQGKYEAANKQMDIFAKMAPNDNRAKAHLADPDFVPSLENSSKLYTVEEAPFNTAEQSDFGAVLTNNNILYFVSTRNTGKKEDSWTKQPYLDIYKANRNDDGTFTQAEPVNSLNTPYHDGPITLSEDGKTIIFSRDGHSQGLYKKLDKKQVKLAQQGLYQATLIDGKWDNIKPLPFNSNEYSVSHPSLSSDGKTLFFASNMPGGLGDTDIWKVSITNGKYGEPENLGPNVNTPGKEGFPFISGDNILYFSSRGKKGFGGFDIFRVDLNKSEEAENLGKDINTKSDDFSFSINSKNNVGFYASNKSGNDQIYVAVPVCKFDAIALVKDAKTKALLNLAKVSLNAKANVLAVKNTTTNGKTSFNVTCENPYSFTIEKEGYESLTVAVKPNNGEAVVVEALLIPIVENELITETEVKLNNIYFEFNKSNITAQGASELDKLVAIMKAYPNMEILVQSHTDTKGKAAYNLSLSEKRAQSTVQYLISKGIEKNRLSAKGLGSTQPKIDCTRNCTKEDDAKNRRSEFLIIKK